MNWKLIASIVVLLLIGVGFFFFRGEPTGQAVQDISEEEVAPQDNSPEPNEPEGVEMESEQQDAVTKFDSGPEPQDFSIQSQNKAPEPNITLKDPNDPVNTNKINGVLYQRLEGSVTIDGEPAAGTIEFLCDNVSIESEPLDKGNFLIEAECDGEIKLKYQKVEVGPFESEGEIIGNLGGGPRRGGNDEGSDTMNLQADEPDLNPVPEFTPITALFAVLVAGLGITLIRRN